MDNDTDFGAFLAGILVGGLIGAAAALLLAPQSGEETRTMIKDKSIELKEKASETAEEALDKANKTLEETRTKLTSSMDDLRTRVDELSASLRQQGAEVKVAETPAPKPAKPAVGPPAAQ
jgi:gas vesicle protein